MFYVQIKRPYADIKYQEEGDEDFIKKQMKSLVDKQTKLGIESPISYGLLLRK